MRACARKKEKQTEIEKEGERERKRQRKGREETTDRQITRTDRAGLLRRTELGRVVWSAAIGSAVYVAARHDSASCRMFGVACARAVSAVLGRLPRTRQPRRTFVRRSRPDKEPSRSFSFLRPAVTCVYFSRDLSSLNSA